ncbi:hypothetical protein TPA0910_41460 [Streptomyces hygroscopicus subsp. sporocinereus]|uniref:Uncharacterized protein n=1 Tax=Streptomyces hygroscopicus TaxID=1912 RepID=A0ABQ3U2A9_STRHY|nr:hypothetical protein TPA0910_41460 [Streptomyces hygroscopicus]
MAAITSGSGDVEKRSWPPLARSAEEAKSTLTATVTATSVDDGCGRRVVRGVVLALESVAQGVDGVTLESESYVGVDAGDDADVGMAERGCGGRGRAGDEPSPGAP